MKSLRGAVSSAGQSASLTSRRSGVRVLYRPLFNFENKDPVKTDGYKYKKVAVVFFVPLLLITLVLASYKAFKTHRSTQEAAPTQNQELSSSLKTATRPQSKSTTQIQPGETIQIKVKSPFSDEGKIYWYKFGFDRKPDDIIRLIPATHQDQDLYTGIEVTRKNIKLIIQPAFEGVNRIYDKKPEVHKLKNPKISTDPIYRIREANLNAYIYVSDYGEGTEKCSQGSPVPVACSMSNVYTNKGKGLDIYCLASPNSVTECDNIVKTLDIEIKEI